MTDDTLYRGLESFLGPKIEREAANPEGAKYLREHIKELDALELLALDLLERIETASETLRKVADEWEGRPLYGPGPLDITETPFLKHVIKRHEPTVQRWGMQFTPEEEGPASAPPEDDPPHTPDPESAA